MSVNVLTEEHKATLAWLQCALQFPQMLTTFYSFKAKLSLCSCVVAVPLQLSSRAYSVVPPPRDSEEKEMLDRILRVDHAGEYGANRIYAGQMAVLGRSRTGPLIQV